MHVRNLRRLKYGKILLRVFAKKPSVALKFILRSATRDAASTTLPIDLSILRDETTGRLITTKSAFVTKLAQMETAHLSKDPALPPGAPFSWIGRTRPSLAFSVSIISGQIILAIMQKALHRVPKHKAAGLDGVPELILKPMPPALDEALHLIFQALAITRITPPS